jgi:hypothetical protein
VRWVGTRHHGRQRPSCRSRNSRVNRTPRRSKRDSNRWSLSRRRHLIIAEEKGLQVDQGYLKGAIAFSRGDQRFESPSLQQRVRVSHRPGRCTSNTPVLRADERCGKNAGYVIPKHDFPKKLMYPLPRKAISSVPKLAHWTPFALVIDSFLVRTPNYAIRHHY